MVFWCLTCSVLWDNSFTTWNPFKIVKPCPEGKSNLLQWSQSSSWAIMRLRFLVVKTISPNLIQTTRMDCNYLYMCVLDKKQTEWTLHAVDFWVSSFCNLFSHNATQKGGAAACSQANQQECQALKLNWHNGCTMQWQCCMKTTDYKEQKDSFLKHLKSLESAPDLNILSPMDG